MPPPAPMPTWVGEPSKVMLPLKVAESLANSDVSTLPGRLTADVDCEGGMFHSTRPLLVHRMTLEDGRQARLCGVCVANVTSTSGSGRSPGHRPWR